MAAIFKVFPQAGARAAAALGSSGAVDLGVAAATAAVAAGLSSEALGVAGSAFAVVDAGASCVVALRWKEAERFSTFFSIQSPMIFVAADSLGEEVAGFSAVATATAGGAGAGF